MTDPHYLKLLSKEYPTVKAATAEMINLQAILSLPKGTEYFFSDLHGEHQAFIHALKSASGMIRNKIDDLFEKSVSSQERTALAALIYDPERELPRICGSEPDYGEWCRITIYRLVEVMKAVSAKYTRSKVRKKVPEDFRYIIDELMYFDSDDNRSRYYGEIVGAIIGSGIAEQFITSLCAAIRQLSVDRLHIIGDIFDRGPHADAIMDELMKSHDVDIQWGNHDISWMGAVAGNWACIANVIRLGISYNNFDLLEDGYGINLRSLSVFASQMYADDPCELFTPHILDENKYDPVDIRLAAKMHKAIAMIQFKVEGQLIQRHPEYQMDDRILLNRIDFQKGTIQLGNTEYPLEDRVFPTVDPKDPLALTGEEENLMQTIAASFRHSDLLHRHIRFLYSNGSMYKITNSNLLYHGCIPMKENGEFETVTFDGKTYSGRSYLEYIDNQVRRACFAPSGSEEKHNARDFMWYLWCGPKSPLFGKSKMAAFEHYFIRERAVGKEKMNPYYSLVEHREICEKLLTEFGMDPDCSHIINGHVPVRIKQGESPVKGEGKLFFIDGGMSKAYQSQTGIAGYTFIFNSHFMALAEHKPFQPCEEGDCPVENSPAVHVVETMKKRMRVADTDTGKELQDKIEELSALLKAYQEGLVKEM